MNEPSWTRSAIEVLGPALVFGLSIVGAFTAGITAMVLKARQNERLHKERMLFVEKGIEVPPELYGVVEKKTRDYRTTRVVLLITGVFMLLMGPCVVIGIGIQEGFREAAPGLSVVGIGAGLLVAERLIARNFTKNGRNGEDPRA